jgi:hypothetical protein
MSLAAALFVEPSGDRRVADRLSVSSPATARKQDAPIDVMVRDLSRGGCLIETNTTLSEGAMIRLGISGVRVREAEVVRLTDDGYGCRFLKPLSEAEVELAGRVDNVARGHFSDAIDIASATPVQEPAEAVRPSGIGSRVGAGLGLLLMGTVWSVAFVVAAPLLLIDAMGVPIFPKEEDQEA